MQKKTLLLLIFLSQFSFGFSQNHLIGIEKFNLSNNGHLSIASRYTKQYDDAGNEIYEGFERWPFRQGAQDTLPPPTSLVLYNDVHKSFNTNNQITSLTYQGYRDWRNTKYEYTYTYNGDCLEKVDLKRYHAEELYRQEITFYNPNTCRIDYLEVFVGSNSTSLEKIFENRFTYQIDADNNLFESQISYYKDAFGNFTIPISETQTTRNEEGLIIRILGDSDIGPELFIKDYDEQGNLTYNAYLSESWTTPDSFELNTESIYENEYSEDNQLLKINATTTSFNGPATFSVIPSTITFEYACDGLLKKRTEARSSSTRVETYQYEKGHNCDLNKDANLLTLKPNFTNDIVVIESEILEIENTFIELYDLSGKRLSSKKVNRINRYSMDLTDLPAGHYIIRVFNKRHSIAERVIKI